MFPKKVGSTIIRRVSATKRSICSSGVRQELACEALEEKGIAMIFEPHLDQTYLDGVALPGATDRPVTGLTLMVFGHVTSGFPATVKFGFPIWDFPA